VNNNANFEEMKKKMLIAKVLLGIGVAFAVLGYLSYRLAGFGFGIIFTLVGFGLALLAIFITVYGSTVGMKNVCVKQVEFVSQDLPSAFNGYRIALFSDAHVGSFPGDEGVSIIRTAVDSILAQQADMIAFVGDLENMQPSELDPVQPELSRLHAVDGVYSILGNHDYAMYLHADSVTSMLNEQLLQSKERSMGWTLLMNENRVIHRGGDSIAIAGMENDGRPPCPEKGSVEQAVRELGKGTFVVMLQHDPTAWRRHILPQCDAQLTLSGHTHGAQFSIFGWSPASLTYREWGGMYHELKRALYVTTGIGGFVPFRFGMKPEVVVITLKKNAEP